VTSLRHLERYLGQIREKDDELAKLKSDMQLLQTKFNAIKDLRPAESTPVQQQGAAPVEVAKKAASTGSSFLGRSKSNSSNSSSKHEDKAMQQLAYSIHLNFLPLFDSVVF